MSENEKTQKYPGPLYAAAGFGDLAAEKLRTLPDRMAEVSEWARDGRAQNDLAEFGGKLGAGLSSVRERAQHLGDTDVRTDLRRFQTVARRRANTLANAAARNLSVAQGRAVHAYDNLVARGSDVLDPSAPAEPTRALIDHPAAPVDDVPKAAGTGSAKDTEQG